MEAKRQLPAPTTTLRVAIVIIFCQLCLLGSLTLSQEDASSSAAARCQLADWNGTAPASGAGRRVTLQRDNWNSVSP
jgi:hypothetical protein